jgi:pimeloyl-ACP methyl ester carboxylesterase
MDPAFSAAYDALFRRWGVPLEQFDLTSEFGTTRVTACGPADAPPLVLLAGHGATSPVWFGVGPALAKTHRVYAVDLIGDAGRSVLSRAKFTNLAELHSWLTTVLDGLQLPRTSLCGHSYGSWLALTYALHAPSRVDRLALIDPTDCFVGLSPLYVARALPVLLRPTRARNASFLRWETQGVPVEPAWLTLTDLAAEFPTVRPVRPRRPSAEQLRGLRADLLVVVGGRSKSQDPERLASRVKQSVPGATVVRIDQATHHSLPAAHTDELTAALRKQLA